MAVSLVPPKTTEGVDLSATLIESIGFSNDILQETATSIGEQLSQYISNGVIDGLSDNEKLMITELSSWLNRIETAVAQGKVSGEFGAGLNILLTDLTRDSFSGVLEAYQGMVDELTTSYTELEKQAYADAVAYAAGLTEAKAYYDSIGDVVNAQKTQEALDAVNKQIENWDILASVESAVNIATAPGQATVFSAFQDIFGGAMTTIIDQRPFTDLATEVMNGMFDGMTIDNATEWSEGVRRRIDIAIEQAFGEDYEIAMDVANMFDLTGWDLLTDEVQTQIFGSFESAFGSAETWKIFEDIGYDMTGVIAQGIASGAFQVENEAGDLVITLKDGTKVAVGKWDSTIVSMFDALGVDIVDGMVAGIDGEMTDSIKTLLDIFGIPYDKAAEENEVNSPSELFKRLGTYIVEGLIAGLGTLYTKLKDTWTTLPSWFQTFINKIVGMFTGMNVDVGDLFEDTKDDIQDAWSPVSGWFGTNVKNPIVALFTRLGFKNIGSESATGLKEGLLSIDMPVLQPLVALVRKGWETVSGWVHGLFGNTNNDESVSLLKSGWTTVSSWVKSLMGNTDVTKGIGISTTSAWSTVSSWISNNKMGGSVTKAIGLKTGFLSGVATVAAWLLLDSIFGGSVTKNVNLGKGNWAGKSIAQWCADNSSSETGTVTVNLAKGNWSSLSSFITSDWRRTCTVNLKKGNSLTYTITTGTKSISIRKDGGFVDAGQMFIAREAGPELVGNIGGRTAVANNDQIVEAVAAGVYGAVSQAMYEANGNGGNSRIVVNLDGKTIYENQQGIARGRGYDLGMGAFSFG